MAVFIAAGFTGTLYPLSTPRIGWRRRTGTVAASTSAAGYPAANAASYRTDSFWRPTALPATWRLDAGAGVSVGYVGIAAHDLGSRVCTVLVQSSTDDVNWTTRLTIAPTDDTAIFGLFASATARYWRLNISGSFGEPTIGVIQFGLPTEFPRPAVYAPSISFQRTRNVTYSANITEGGQWAGRSIVRTTLAPEMTVNHLSETWIGAEWDAFALHAETSPFFVADRPGSYPASCAYAWTTADLRAQRDVANATIANSVTLSLTGFLA
jgi:hypothetical protein